MRPATGSIAGISKTSPRWSFSGIYPINTAEFEQLRTAVGKFQLNDPALTYTQESVRRSRLWIPLWIPRFCCTWRSCQERTPSRVQHGSSSRPIPSVHLRSAPHQLAKSEMIDNPMHMPDPSVHRGNPGADGQGFHHVPERLHRRHHAADYGKSAAPASTRVARQPPVSCCVATCALNEILVDFQ